MNAQVAFQAELLQHSVGGEQLPTSSVDRREIKVMHCKPRQPRELAVQCSSNYVGCVVAAFWGSGSRSALMQMKVVQTQVWDRTHQRLHCARIECSKFKVQRLQCPATGECIE